ncbi:NADPH-dependent FMN reductase [Flavobacteriales bacterium ALC-1]|nr:NADPH-dependent FMN reductase [Flavobacteriales bacterium ALC-1]
MSRGVIIQASSRNNGDTHKMVSVLQEHTGYDIINLNKKNIGHFDYEFKNAQDDFKALFIEITDKYETIVFATPIYWYTMSGLLKVFLDRISDFLYREKDIGRRLREMRMAVLSCSNEVSVFDGFLMPFEKSAEYLGMEYLGHIHTCVENDTISKEMELMIKEFANKRILAHV